MHEKDRELEGELEERYALWHDLRERLGQAIGDAAIEGGRELHLELVFRACQRVKDRLKEGRR